LALASFHHDEQDNQSLLLHGYWLAKSTKKGIDGALGNFAGVFADGSHKLKKLLLLISRGESGEV
jgi:hypothetical protein